MKKSLIAIAALAAAGAAAAAQSSVTLYGVVDTSYGMNRVKTGNVTTRKVGLNEGKYGNLSGSRWGLKGQEDLGNGLSAVFNVEAGFNSADGAFKTGFNRRSVVGLKGSFGEVLVGTDYTPMDKGPMSFYATDIHTGATHPLNSKYEFYTARSKGLHYNGNFSGVSVNGLVGYTEGKVTSPAGSTVGKGSVVGLGLGYASGPFAVSAAAQHFRQTTSAPGVEATGHVTEYGIAGSYDFTAAKLYAHYAANKPKGGKAWQQAGVGVSVPFNAFTLGAQYVYSKAGDYKGHNFGLEGRYAMSKRTDLYAKAARYDAWKLGNWSTRSDMFSVGIRHKF
ncbi:MAG: porin [Brachymonas sp.]|nr:porin [Brachymonas sp.]